MENRLTGRNERRKKRALRVRKNVRGDSQKPRLSVFRSNKHLHAQVIDDESHKTLFGFGTSSKGTKEVKKSKEAAKEIGRLIAESAKKHNIAEVVFDRGYYKYHGVIAELANAAREAGLKF